MSIALVWLLLVPSASSAEFFPPVRSNGETTVVIRPIESVRVGQTLRVSFGIPFPKGWLTDLNSLRVLDNSHTELAIFAEVLSLWRDLGSLRDETSIRAALVQLDITFPDDDGDGQANDVPLFVQWGSIRTEKVLSAVPVRDNWVLVDDDHYPASARVFEPPAYALFTPEWYGQAVLKTRLVPMGWHPDFSMYDAAFLLFGDTMINHVDPRVASPNLINYLSNFEPWLFDRAMTLYQLAFRSGDFTFLREAHRAAQFYAGQIDPTGFFDLRPRDMKYVYGESIATNYWLAGDDRMPGIMRRMLAAWDGFNAVYTLNTRFWTERHAAFKLLGYVTAFELLGEAGIGLKARETFAALVDMQDNPVEGAPNTGGLMHTRAAGGEGGRAFVASPWMSTLLVDAVERYYIHSGDTRAKQFVYRLADFMITPDATYVSRLNPTASFKVSNWPYLLPFYLAGPNLTLREHVRSTYNDKEHAIDVSKILGLAYYFSLSDGTPNARYLETFSDLYKVSSELAWPFWIRPSGPRSESSAFRLSPPRKFNWWFRTTANLDWLIGRSTRLTESQDRDSVRLELALAVDKTVALPGDEVTYTITYQNVGSEDAKEVVIRTPSFISFLRFVEPGVLEIVPESVSSGGSFSQTKGQVFWRIGNVEAGAPPQTLSYQVRVIGYPVTSTEHRPVAPYINRAAAFYCNVDALDSECVPAANINIEGIYTHQKHSNSVVIASTPPPTRQYSPPPPLIAEGGVLNHAAYSLASRALSPGMMVAIFGTNLTDGTSCLPPSCTPTFGSHGRLNTTMSGAQVTVNGVPAPIYYASPWQVGIQMPTEVTGTEATIQVSVGEESCPPHTVSNEPVSPGIFTFTGDGRGAGAFTHLDGSPVSTQNPARPGEQVILYATGLGQVSPPVATGALPSGESRTVVAPLVVFDGVSAIPEFAGLAGCCVGLNQVNVQIPAGTRSANDIPVVLIIDGEQSNIATIAVR